MGLPVFFWVWFLGVTGWAAIYPAVGRKPNPPARKIAASPASPRLNRYRKSKAPIENEASASLTLGVAYGYQPASSAHDRRHDHPPFRREDAEGLHPLLEEPCPAYRPSSPTTTPATF